MNIWPLILCVVWLAPLGLFSQCAVPDQLPQALGLEQRGQYAQAIGVLQPMVASGSLCPSEADRIWTYIGYAEQEQGDFEDARHAYQQAIHIARALPVGTGDYPAALDDLAGLDQAGGNLGSASRLERRALRLFRKSGNHIGAAWACTHLAVIELTRRHVRSAQRYLENAANEARTAPRMGNSYYASLASVKAWLAVSQGDSLTAIREYRRSIALQPCDNCALTGWRYVLLGKAYAESGQLTEASETMRRGLSTLGSTVGEHAPRYLAAELAYARVLDQTGDHSQADALRVSAKKEANALHRGPCKTCGIGFAGVP